MLALCLAALLQMSVVGGAFGGGAEPAPGAVDLQVAVGAKGVFKKGNSDARFFGFRKSKACAAAWLRNQPRTCG